MNKLIAALVAGLFASTVFAQAAAPAPAAPAPAKTEAHAHKASKSTTHTKTHSTSNTHHTSAKKAPAAHADVKAEVK